MTHRNPRATQVPDQSGWDLGEGSADVGRLSPAYRAAALEQLCTQTLDVLVVGGGIVGAGSALDAATRGLNVGLIEARDWASGTSSASSKLLHGGLRYLEMLDFSLVSEALTERGLMVTHLAPHLARPVQFIYPLKYRAWERLYVGSGVTLYDVLARAGKAKAGMPAHRHLTHAQAMNVAPGLNPDSFVGAITYYDAQTDDARFVATVVRTAAAYGTQVANRVAMVELLRDGDGSAGSGTVIGVLARDVETGDTFEIKARRVIVATGVWTSQLLGAATSVTVQASKGVHLVVDRDRIASSCGVIARTEKSVLFVIPWGEHWIIGTTDTPWTQDVTAPAATSTDVEYLLERVNQVLAEPLTQADIRSVYVGLRPLLAGMAAPDDVGVRPRHSESSKDPRDGRDWHLRDRFGKPRATHSGTAQLSREHVVDTPEPGLVVVAGGKYTTYRVMAADAVDVAVVGLGASVPQSCTKTVPLLGAIGWAAQWNSRARLARETGLNQQWVEHLLHRYGSLMVQVARLIADDPRLGRSITGAPGYLLAEVVYAVTHEGARHLEDVLQRRTRISIETADAGAAAAPQVAQLLAELLGWSDQHRDREVQQYLSAAVAAAQGVTQSDDEAAAQLRQEAGELLQIKRTGSGGAYLGPSG